MRHVLLFFIESPHIGSTFDIGVFGSGLDTLLRNPANPATGLLQGLIMGIVLIPVSNSLRANIFVTCVFFMLGLFGVGACIYYLTYKLPPENSLTVVEGAPVVIGEVKRGEAGSAVGLKIKLEGADLYYDESDSKYETIRDLMYNGRSIKVWYGPPMRSFQDHNGSYDNMGYTIYKIEGVLSYEDQQAEIRNKAYGSIVGALVMFGLVGWSVTRMIHLRKQGAKKDDSRVS